MWRKPFNIVVWTGNFGGVEKKRIVRGRLKRNVFSAGKRLFFAHVKKIRDFSGPAEKALQADVK